MKKFFKYAFILMCIDSISKYIFKYIETKTINSKIFNQGQLILLVGFMMIGFITIIILKSNKASKSAKFQDDKNVNSNACCSCKCCQCCKMKSVNHNM